MFHARPAFAHLLFPASVVLAVAVVLVLLPSAAQAKPPPAWRWPLPGEPEVVRGFDPPDQPWGAGHRGVDLGAYAGEAVYAAGDGRVGYVGRIDGRGIVTVVHGDRRTTYLPVRASVRAGDRVKAGARIGAVEPGFAHCPARVCLHWGLIRGKTYLDPLSLIPRSPIRLLPLNGPGLGFPLLAGSAAPGAPHVPTPGTKPVPQMKPVSELARSALAGTGGAGLVLLVLAASSRATRRRPQRPPNSKERQRATAMHYHPAGGRRFPPRSRTTAGADATRNPRADPDRTSPDANETPPDDGRRHTPGIPLLTAIHPLPGGRHRKICRLRRILIHLRRRRTTEPSAPPSETTYAKIIDLDAERRIRRPAHTDEQDPA